MFAQFSKKQNENCDSVTSSVPLVNHRIATKRKQL